SLFYSRRFDRSDRGLLVRTVGGLNGSTQRRSILPMLLSPRERPQRATTCSMFSAWDRVLLQNQPMSLVKMEHDVQLTPSPYASCPDDAHERRRPRQRHVPWPSSGMSRDCLDRSTGK